MPLMSDKPATSLRFDSDVQKQRWQECAERQKRSLSNWIKFVCDEAADKELAESDATEGKRKK